LKSEAVSQTARTPSLLLKREPMSETAWTPSLLLKIEAVSQTALTTSLLLKREAVSQCCLCGHDHVPLTTVSKVYWAFCLNQLMAHLNQSLSQFMLH
jgi:hypothetical protein